MVSALPDLFFSEAGDIKISPGGDIAITQSPWRQDAQDAYVRIMTQPGDFLLYPSLGADLERLYGMPQKKETGDFGAQIITEALNREKAFAGKTITVTAIPTGPRTIRFDVSIKSGARNDLLLSIEKDIGIDYVGE